MTSPGGAKPSAYASTSGSMGPNPAVVRSETWSRPSTADPFAAPRGHRDRRGRPGPGNTSSDATMSTRTEGRSGHDGNGLQHHRREQHPTLISQEPEHRPASTRSGSLSRQPCIRNANSPARNIRSGTMRFVHGLLATLPSAEIYFIYDQERGTENTRRQDGSSYRG